MYILLNVLEIPHDSSRNAVPEKQKPYFDPDKSMSIFLKRAQWIHNTNWC